MLDQTQTDQADIAELTDAQRAAVEKAYKRTHAVEVLKQAKPADRSDWIFVGSFLGAAAFGIANAINTIRHGFYESFVKPNPGVVSGYQRKIERQERIIAAPAMSDMLKIAKEGVDPTNSVRHPFGDVFQQRQQVYEALAEKYHRSGKTLQDGIQYRLDKIRVTKEIGGQIDKTLMESFGIHTRSWRGWTTDIFKQRQHTGDYTRRNALFTGAQSAVVTLGAIATLKYSKHLLDLLSGQEKAVSVHVRADNDNAHFPAHGNAHPGVVVDSVSREDTLVPQPSGKALS